VSPSSPPFAVDGGLAHGRSSAASTADGRAGDPLWRPVSHLSAVTSRRQGQAYAIRLRGSEGGSHAVPPPLQEAWTSLPSSDRPSRACWSLRRDSNPGPLPYQGSALPPELRRPNFELARSTSLITTSLFEYFPWRGSHSGWGLVYPRRSAGRLTLRPRPSNCGQPGPTSSGPGSTTGSLPVRSRFAFPARTSPGTGWERGREPAAQAASSSARALARSLRACPAEASSLRATIAPVRVSPRA
jgi:hypothetical protein